MNLLEILKSNGISDDVINKITDEMRSNKVYTASEENLDIRYGKLKKDHAESQATITDLQSQIAEFEKLKLENATLVENANTKIADSIGEGWVYTGKKGKKKNRITLEEFSSHQSGVLNTCKLAETGMDISGLSVGIMLGVNSSTTKATQTRGRVIRKEPNKIAEYFTLVINDTVELKWWEKSHEKDTNIIKIDVENLMHLLRGEPWQPYKKKITNFTFRF